MTSDERTATAMLAHTVLGDEVTASGVILVAGLGDADFEIAQAASPRELVRLESIGEDSSLLRRAVAIVGSTDPAVLALAPRLLWVHTWTAGVDADLNDELRRRPIMLTSSSGNGAIPLAEHAMLLLLQLNRNSPRWARAQHEHRWDRFEHGELAGLALGLFGVGHAGADLARKADAFHMTVIGCRRNADVPVPNVSEMYPIERLLEFLARCDAVVVTAPLTADTRDAFTETEFRAMKNSALWICVSRGGIANDAALARALREGWIAGAGIDAHGVEPLDPDSPFWDVSNTIVTPHNGATTAATARRGIEIFIENLRRFSVGEPLLNVVDKKAGY